MAQRSRYPKAENAENSAFEKLTASLRLGIEAAQELAVHQERQQWTGVAVALQKTLHLVTELKISSRVANLRVN